MGIAKKASARVLSDAGLTAPGGIWAVRCSARPIRDRTHQLAVAHYIRKHAQRGAVVWSLRHEPEAQGLRSPGL